MKRFVIATASALFLLAGTAAASVPVGPGTRSPRAAAAAAAASLFPGLPGNGYAAYGTASVIHTDLLQAGDQRLENLDAAFSAASVASAGIPQTTNEMARIISPALAAGNAYG